MRRRVQLHQRHIVLLVLIAANLVSSIDKISISVAIPYIAADLHLQAVAMGAVMSAFFLSYSISQIPGGLLADRFGVRRVASLAMIWWSAFTALTGAISSLAQLIAVRFIFGLGEGMFPACAFKTVAQSFPRKERATANSVMFASVFLGSAIAPLLVVAILAVSGWREVFFALFLPGLVMAFLFWKFVGRDSGPKLLHSNGEREPLGRADKEDVEGAAAGLREILLTPTAISYFLIVFTFDLTYAGFTAWLPTYLLKARSLSMVQMGFAASLPAFAGTVGCILAGWMSDRLFSQHRRLPIIGSQLLAAIFLYLTFTSSSTALLVTFQTVAGFFIMFFFGVFWALPMNSVPPRHMGVMGAFINMAGQIAAITSPLVIGYLVEVAHGAFGGAFAFLIGALLLSSLIVGTIPASGRPKGIVARSSA